MIDYFSYLLLEKSWEKNLNVIQSFCVTAHNICKQLGPVVQSIVSLTRSLRGQLVKCFTTL